MDKNILVCADRPKNALEAVKEIEKMIHHVPNVEVTLIYVYPVSGYAKVMNENKHDFQERLQQESALFFKDASAYLDRRHIPHKKMIRVGNPAQEVLLAVQFEHIDLLVVACHYAMNERENMAKSLVRKVKCPVLIVKEKQGELS